MALIEQSSFDHVKFYQSQQSLNALSNLKESGYLIQTKNERKQMKQVLQCLVLLLSATMYGQQEFIIGADGLAPKNIASAIDQKNELFTKTLAWIEANEEEYKLSIAEQSENVSITFSSIKGNAVTLADRYFHAKYDIQVRFEEDQLLFEPSQIQLKVNSKYDMGWKDFDLKDPSTYFKKGKVIRKYKAYLGDLVKPLNQLQLELTSHLKGS